MKKIVKEKMKRIINFALASIISVVSVTGIINQNKNSNDDKKNNKAEPKWFVTYKVDDKPNLFDSEAIPNKSNDIFKASQLVVANNIINNKHKLRNQVELDIVDKWIEESKILEQYYELYLKRK